LYIVATRLDLCTYILYNSKGYIFEGAKSEVSQYNSDTEVASTHQTKGSCCSIKLPPFFNIGR